MDINLQENQIPVSEKSKAELFEDNPERFEDLKHCLLVVKRDTETKKFFVLNQCESIEESYIVEGFVRDAMSAFRNSLRVKAAQTGIVGARPKRNGFLAGLRAMNK